VDDELKSNKVNVFVAAAVVTASIFACVVGCSSTAEKKIPQGPMAMPVKVESVSVQPVPVSDDYVATIKSRRSATIQPQVSGNLTQIFVHSGDHVKSGQLLMELILANSKPLSPSKKQQSSRRWPFTSTTRRISLVSGNCSLPG